MVNAVCPVLSSWGVLCVSFCVVGLPHQPGRLRTSIGGHLDPAIRERLLASVEARRLVVVCGAGLSMAPPSRLPSANAVAVACFDRYRLSVDPNLNPALRGDLEALAEHFVALGTFKTVFIDQLVPWSLFSRPPNKGHAAVADFLITGVAAAALSANFDCLIERRAWDYSAEFTGSLDGDEAIVRAGKHSPLLKFHGCALRDPGATVWTRSQLAQPPVSIRIAKSRIWMAANLREKDFLVIGFWSDWTYFNDILADALHDVSPLSITLVDPSPADALRDKAPDLWAVAHAPNVRFEHIEESGADVLDELRRAFSRGYLRKVLDAGRPTLEAGGVACDAAWLEPPDLGSEDLYDLRRDAEGVSTTTPAKRREPEACEQLGFFHLLLRRAGAVAIAGGYQLGGRSIRVVNGAGMFISTIRARFAEPPAVGTFGIVVCVGASNVGLPGNFVREGRPGDIMRPASSANWLDLDAARMLLEI